MLKTDNKTTTSTNNFELDRQIKCIREGFISTLDNPTLLTAYAQQLTLLIEHVTDSDELPQLIDACAKPTDEGYHKGTNAFYWLAVAINDAARNKFSPEQRQAIRQPLLSLIEKAIAENQLTQLIDALAKPPERWDHKGKNAFYWLAVAIYHAADYKLSPEQCQAISQPLLMLIEKTIAENQLTQLIDALAKPAEAYYDKGKNAFYWLARAINDAAYHNLSLEQCQVISKPLLSLIEKAIAENQLTQLIDALAKPVEAGNDKGKNAFYWLAGAIYHAAAFSPSPEQCQAVSQPLLMLIEKAHTQDQLNTIIAGIKTVGTMSTFRKQLKTYLLRDQDNETPAAKLARLECYLNPDKPLSTLLSTHNYSFFTKKGSETDTVVQLRAEVARLKSEMRHCSTSTPQTFRIPSWQSQTTNTRTIVNLLNSRDQQALIAKLDEQDENGQTLRNFLYQQAKSCPYILYLMLTKNLVRDEDGVTIVGMQAAVFEFINKNMSGDGRAEALAMAQDESHPLYRFLCRDKSIKAKLLAPATIVNATLFSSPKASEGNPTPPPSYEDALCDLLPRTPTDNTDALNIAIVNALPQPPVGNPGDERQQELDCFVAQRTRISQRRSTEYTP